MPTAYLCLVLHAHLPHVRHPEYEDCLEERWLFEALTETYLPLIEVIDGWRNDGIDFRLTLSLSPTLTAMLDDPMLRDRYRRHLNKLVELAELEVTRTRWMSEFHPSARHYLERFQRMREIYEQTCGGDVAGALGRLAGDGRLELITCNATHGFLPLLQKPEAVARAQVRVAVETFRKRFGRAPAGLWLGECGYYPGLEEILAREGIGYFFVDAHGLLFAERPPLRGVFAPVRCPSGTAVFGRDPETTREVWNAWLGYPGDPAYREYYRDIGFDLEYDYLRPYIHDSGLRIATGVKYHRVTGSVPLHAKQPYDPAAARERAVHHAGDFVRKRVAQAERIADRIDRPPLVVSPYDAELFGHWWYEGPIFLDALTRRLTTGADGIEPVTPSQYLQRHGELETLRPELSSWGSGGQSQVWLHESNTWIYPHLHESGQRMVEMANKHRGTNNQPRRRALNQMARELLLAQSSDWPFMMKTGRSVSYAARRVREHVGLFNALYQQVNDGPINEDLVGDLEARRNLFTDLQFEVYAD